MITYLGLVKGWFIVMLVSNILIFLGIWIISAGWEMVYKSEGKLVASGIYRYVRHPQYAGIYVITLGFMIQRPTITTLILWPFVIWMYYKLAQKEEQEALEKFPEQYNVYMKKTPMFFPKLSIFMERKKLV
jgi:protein-S-isoprenylcysteine O-methyltransferase Ste14